jgi:hypothetical protein
VRSLDYSAKIAIPDSVLMQELDGEAVLLNLDSGKYFGLDEVGTRMWQLLQSSASIQVAFDQILDEYEVEPGQLRSDLEGLIAELTAEKLIEIEVAETADDR